MPVLNPNVTSAIACGSQMDGHDERFFWGNRRGLLRETTTRNQTRNRKRRFPSLGNHETVCFSQPKVLCHLSAVRGRFLKRRHAFALPSLFGFRCAALYFDIQKKYSARIYMRLLAR